MKNFFYCLFSELHKIMRAWFFVFAVLATFNGQQVASTEEVKKSSSSAFITSSSSSRDSSSSIDNRSNSIYNSYDNGIDLSDRVENENHRKGEKPDPQTLVQIEKNLLSLFGFEKRPKVDRSKIVIPEAMKKLYAQITGHELEIDEPKADLHSKEANTIRSYIHEGECCIPSW